MRLVLEPLDYPGKIRTLKKPLLLVLQSFSSVQWTSSFQEAHVFPRVTTGSNCIQSPDVSLRLRYRIFGYADYLGLVISNTIVTSFPLWWATCCRCLGKATISVSFISVCIHLFALAVSCLIVFLLQYILYIILLIYK